MPLPNDPLFPQQWHLGNPVAGLLDLNVRGVWNPTEGLAYTGAGTRVVVIDDGFDYNHPDLAPNYNFVGDYDFENNVDDAFGGGFDAHGTAVAGIIGADNNGTGCVGIAFDTNLLGYRTSGLISDAWLQDIRDAIFYCGTNAGGDVANISQGIANDATSEFGVGYDPLRFDEIEESIRVATSDGRGGLGTTIVKSAGNSRADNYDVNADDWTNDTRQVVVAAVDQNGYVSDYSSYGAALLVSGFGTPGEVLTTDRLGSDGYETGDFTYSFNGTSSAAPMVSGVVALMYDANAGLGWRDVQSILAVSARHVGTAVGDGIAGAERFGWSWNGSSTWNGGGMHFSNDYGYGLVDALAAVRLAETWLLAPGSTAAQVTSNEVTNAIDLLDGSTIIPDGSTTGLTFAGNVNFDDEVERVTVEMSFSTTYTGDLEVYVISPDGTVSQMIEGVGGPTSFDGTWTFESQAFRGERAGGQWQVRVVDSAGGDVLTVSDIVLRTFGRSSLNDRYVFTNEYSDYAGVAGHVTAVSDTNGGVDTVNASAVTTASSIRLDGTTGRIDGVVVTFSNIENAIGGDGGDTIVGNSAANRLFGMRGADNMYGASGNDSLYGDTGNDTLNGGSGADYLSGGAGTDTASYTSAAARVVVSLVTPANNAGDAAGDTYNSIENLAGSAFNDNLNGNTGVNRITGGAGDDAIKGYSGNDTLSGGTDNDTLNGGAGRDVLDGSSGSDAASYADATAGVTASLANAAGNTGEAEGDSYVSIERLIGSDFNDTLTGANSVNNTLRGGIGNDTLNGLTGNDALEGGAGNDTFVFNTALNATTNADTIMDFRNQNGNDDRFLLDDAFFAGIVGDPANDGRLLSGYFKNITTGAQDSNDRILYDQSTGELFYDSNLLQTGGRILFAKVAINTPLGYQDFFVN